MTRKAVDAGTLEDYTPLCASHVFNHENTRDNRSPARAVHASITIRHSRRTEGGARDPAAHGRAAGTTRPSAAGSAATWGRRPGTTVGGVQLSKSGGWGWGLQCTTYSCVK